MEWKLIGEHNLAYVLQTILARGNIRSMGRE